MKSDCGPSDAKVRRVEKSSDPGPSSTISKLPAAALPETTLDQFLEALSQICLGQICLDKNPQDVIKLAPVKIVNSNAAKLRGGASFSSAYCELELGEKRFPFGGIFLRGIDLCLGYIDGNWPGSKSDCIVLEKLIHFLLGDDKIGVCLETLTETERIKLLANHLFGKLSTSPCYTIDRNCKSEKDQTECSCGKEECKFTGEFGDTSIGNGEVWHGPVDIITENNLIIEALSDEDEDEPCAPGGRSAVLSRNPQIVAKTIVFSFLQKYRHPERENFLTPCIGLGSTSLLVMFYDAENDVLLESVKVPLLAEDGSMKFSIEAVVVAWLTVNYKFLCTGITDGMKSFKADFLSQAKDKFQIYQSQLKFTNVGVPTEETMQLKEEFVTNKSVLERQNRIIAKQQERFASKLKYEEG